MKRREFITLLGGATAAWPLAARAQQAERMRRIGLLMGAADDPEGQARVTALKQGLQDLGWTDGRNIQIDIRFGGADTDRIRADAAELVALAPDAIVGQTTPAKWHELAAQIVSPHSSEHETILRVWPDDQKRLAEKMTAQQITEAKRQVSEWLRQHPKAVQK